MAPMSQGLSVVFVAEISLVGRVDELDTHRLATPRDVDDPAGPATAGMLAAVFRRPAKVKVAQPCRRHARGAALAHRR